MDQIQKNLLAQVAELHEVPEGAYNIRANGKAAARNTTAHIDIVSKTDKDGIDIIIKPGTKNESVHIPVVLSESGLTDLVYNDFFVGEGADVIIEAGCGVHSDGHEEARHNGIHRFFLEKGASQRGSLVVYDRAHSAIAEADLAARGPGDFFGDRQHGLPTLHLADLMKDCEALTFAQSVAKQILDQDPTLSRPENLPLKEHVDAMFREFRGGLN